MRGLMRSRRARGQGMVEFALVAPIFFAIFFGAIELGYMVYTNHTLANATREGARYAMVHGERSGDKATIESVSEVVNEHAAALGSEVTVEELVFTGDAEPGDDVTVETSYGYQPIIAMILGTDPITLSNESTVIIQY